MNAQPQEASGLRVLFAMNWGFLPELVGGIQTSILDLCNGLERAGALPAVLCRRTGSRHAFAWRAPRWPILRKTDPAEAMAQVARRRKPHAGVGVQSDLTRKLVSAAFTLGLPTAIDMQTTEIMHIDMPLAPAADLMVFAAEPFAARQLATAYGVAVEPLPLAIDHRRWRPLRARRKRDTLLYVNPHPVKGLEILRRIALARPDYRFVVCESWPLSGDWRRWAEARLAGIANVRHLPPQPDLRPFFARARALLMPSIWEECAARTTIEAQAHGVPVIASARGGLPEQVGAGGVCVDVHAPLDAWLAEVDLLMRDDRHHARLAAAALARARLPDRDLDEVVRRFALAIETHARRVRLAQLAGTA